MITKQAKELLSTEGFIRFFYQVVRNNPDITHNDAYEQVEVEYEKNFGKRRYSCFDSFRQIKKRYLKGK